MKANFRVKCAVLLVLLFGFARASIAKGDTIRVSTVSGGSPPSSEVVKLFRQKITEHPTAFTLVEPKESSPGIIFQTDCLPREDKDQRYVCFYTAHYAGGFGKFFMGGGVNVTKTAEGMADGFISSLAQDITENYESAIRTVTVESLEACLFLTETTCSVPEMLQPEFKVKSINLSQYLRKEAKTKRGEPSK